ncbi:MAG: hypothetical protein HC802_13845, partial [Caldilineaceae bacterium]|nr:hypothetical protein [Caldilineaceae bacterium]
KQKYGSSITVGATGFPVREPISRQADRLHQPGLRPRGVDAHRSIDEVRVIMERRGMRDVVWLEDRWSLEE